MNPPTETIEAAANTPIITALVILWAVLLLGFGMFFFVRACCDDAEKQESLVTAWPASAANFFLFLWLLGLFYLGGGMLLGSAESFLSEPMRLLMGACVVQGAFALSVGALAWFATPNVLTHISPVAIPPWRILKTGVKSFLSFYPLLVLTSVFMYGIAALWRRLDFDYTPTPQDLVTTLQETEHVWLFWAFGFMTVFVAPVVEEFLFRGVLYRFLKSRLRPLGALVLANVVFGLIHFDLSAFLPLCAVGMFFTWAYERTGNIAVPIVCHACLNANTMLLLLAPIPLPGQ